MNPKARILKYKGQELRTTIDISRALEALMCDIVLGNVTLKESRTIQKELNEMIACRGSMLKSLKGLARVEKLRIRERKSGS